MGKAINSPSRRPTRHAAMGPWNGIDDAFSAANEAFMATTSGSFSLSTETTVFMICTSCL